MNELSVDVAVIGAGTAGLRARREAVKAGKRVVMIEGGPHGTTCARVGCMPSKLLIAAADAAHAVGEAPLFGIRCEPPVVDGPAVMDRVRRLRDGFAGHVVETVKGFPEEQKLQGHARFENPNTLLVDDHTRVHAKAVVIATGASPFVPEIFRGLGERLAVNDDVFEWRDLPRSVAVIGTGVIGLELGQALHRLGVSVTLFSHSPVVGPLSDPVMQKHCRRVFGEELTLELNAVITKVWVEDGQACLEWTGAQGESKSQGFEKVLCAAGRRPNLGDMGLEATGLHLNEHGVPVHDDRTMQCGATSIFIAGDVAGERPLLHEAADEGGIAGKNAAAFPEVRAQLRRTPLSIVFTDPQMAQVGMPFGDLSHDCHAIGEYSFADQGRARVIGRNVGAVRLYGCLEGGRLLGASLLGPQVEHLAHLLAWAVQSGQTVQQCLAMPYYHPVLEEGIRSAFHDLAHNMKVAPAVPKGCLDCGPGA